MSTSLEAVQVAPSYGETHVPPVMVQPVELWTTFVPSRLRTTSRVLQLLQNRSVRPGRDVDVNVSPALLDPVRKLGPRIAILRSLGRHRQTSQLAPRGCSRRDSWGRRGRFRSGEACDQSWLESQKTDQDLRYLHKTHGAVRALGYRLAMKGFR